MKNLYFFICFSILIMGNLPADSQDVNISKSNPEQPLFFTPKSHDPNFLKSAKLSTRSFYQRKSDWQHIIDSTWGPGAPLTEKLQLFDEFVKGLHDNADILHSPEFKFDSLSNYYREKINESTSRGGFSAIMSHFAFEFKDVHTFAIDTVVVFSALNPGTPILLMGNANTIEHFGAITTILNDSTTLVLRSVTNHPLNLEPGDIVLGYEGIPWKRLVKELYDANLPILGLLGGCKTAATYHSLIGAGLNWHLFNTIDVLKYSTGDTMHLSVFSLSKLDIPPTMNNEQMPIPNIPFPAFPPYFHPEGPVTPVTFGILENTNVGYIYLSVEYPYFAADGLLYKGLTALKNTDALIIDMRLNPGGWDYFEKSFDLLFNETQATIEHVIRCNTNTFELCSGGNQSDLQIKSNNPDFYDRPIAVLLGPSAWSYGDMTSKRLRYHPMVRFFGASSDASHGWHNTIEKTGWRIEYSRGDLHYISDPNVYLNKKEFLIDYPVWFNKDDVAKGIDPIVEKSLSWIKNLTFGNKVRTDKLIYTPGIDTVKIQATIVNPNKHQVSARLIFESVDGAVIDSTEMSNISLPQDSAWQGIWKIPESLEKTYWISLKVKDLTDGTSFVTKHATKVTTQSLVINKIAFNKNSELSYAFQPSLKNEGEKVSITSLTAKLTSSDSWVKSIKPLQITRSNLSPGQIWKTPNFVVSFDAATYPGYFNLTLTISSDGWPYWVKDTTMLITAIKPEQTLQKANYLNQNYPNPFTISTTISWQLAHSSHATLKVFDLVGREVATLIDAQKPAGKFETMLDASTLPKGVYFYQLKAGEFVETRKMVLLK